ncbi:MAG: NifB/NifX family molybdenum-iron cluster-binding protein [Bacillota bacterium]|jgi:predicted Fe-Mo cluster-binding NifX family protein
MKIAIPVEKNILESKVCETFGRAPYFLIYNSETKECTFIDNNAKASTGGAGVKAAQTIADNKVNVLLVPQCGKNACDILKSADVKIYKTTSDLAKDSIDDFLDGKSSLLDEIHGGFHGRGVN